MKFSELVDESVSLLERQGRVSYRALRREFDLDDDLLDDLKQELVDVLEVAGDRDGTMLVWIGRRTESDSARSHAAAGSDATTGSDAVRMEVERRQITVMFCDLVGSTALSEKLDPEELRRVLGLYQSAARTVVEQYDGYVAQFLGDGIMAYFGWPAAHEEDATRAVRAGLDLVAAMRGLPVSEPLRVRIGIATGTVVVGEADGGDVAEPELAVGETPNVAARLQSLAGPDEIVIGPVTHKLAGGAFEYADLGEHRLKGIAEPVRVRRVTGAGSARDRFEARSFGGVAPLVGRTTETALLLDRWAVAADGEGRVVLLSGEAGIGKSRITMTLREHIADVPHTPLRYQCSPYHLNTAFYPVVQQLERAARFRPDDAPDVRLDKLEAVLARGARDPAKAARLIAPLLSLPVDRYPPLNVSPQRAKEQTHAALAEQAVGLSQDAPVLMIFEDLHWADPTTLELLGVVINRIVDSAVLLVMTFRPEFDPPWCNDSHVTMHSLGRISRRQGVQLVAEVAGEHALPANVQDAIVERADGVPLYVEELTKAVVETEVASRHGEGSSALVPATLHDGLMARLDRLGPGKEIAQLAACIGREFEHRLIAAISDADERDVAGGIERLITAELVYRRGTGPDATYLFKHALVQDAAYQSLVTTRRTAAHRRIAEALHREFHDADSEPAVIAHHFTQAGEIERAVPFWRAAAERAAKRSANEEAISHYSKALELVATLPANAVRDQSELALLMGLGPAQWVTRGFADPEVGTVMDRAHVLCRKLGERREIVDILVGLWAYYVSGQSPLSTARDIADELLAVARDMNDETAALKAHIVMAITLFYQGTYPEVREHVDRCVELYDRDRHHRDFVATSGYDRGVVMHCWSAMAHWMSGRPDSALASTEIAVRLADELAHPYTTAVVMAYSAWVHAWREEWDPALAYATRAAAISDEFGFTLTWAWGTIFRDAAHARSGTRPDGGFEADAAVAKLRGAGIGLWMPHLLAGVAIVDDAIGSRAAAMNALNEGIAHSERRDELFFLPELHRLRGEIHLRAGDGDGAAASFHSALTVARALGAQSFELRAAIALAKLGGDTRAARERVADVRARFTEGFDTTDLRHADSVIPMRAG